MQAVCVSLLLLSEQHPVFAPSTEARPSASGRTPDLCYCKKQQPRLPRTYLYLLATTSYQCSSPENLLMAAEFNPPVNDTTSKYIQSIHLTTAI